jgi:hypothetical protein
VATKYFSLDDANRTLPFVSRIVQDIVDEYRQWRENIYRYELITAGRRADDPETPEQIRLRKAVDDSAHRINGFIEELSLVGCVFKGFEEGLVDFRSRMQDRDIFLCWKLGEPEIQHWHEVDAGFAGRRALSPQPASGPNEPE